MAKILLVPIDPPAHRFNMPTNAKNTTNYTNFYLKWCDFVVVVLVLLFTCEILALSLIRLLNLDNIIN